MCKAPKPPAAPTPTRPNFLRNPVLDASEGSTVGQLRIGRSSLRTDGPGPIRRRKVSDAEEFVPSRFDPPRNFLKGIFGGDPAAKAKLMKQLKNAKLDGVGV